MGMVLVRAIVRPEKADAVLSALLEAGYPAVTKISVFGRGKQRGLKVGEIRYDELPKELLLTVVQDRDKEFVLKAIMESARTEKTGAYGDGKIFVSPVEEVYTVSSGIKETGKASDIMKEVMAIIRINMMNKTKEALAKEGISSFTATGKVLGRGRGNVDFRILAGAQEGLEEAISYLGQGPRLVPKRLITIVVPDNLVEKTVDTIIMVNQTGKPGDGKIFVMPISEAYRVRTKESGDSVLDER